MSSGSYMQVYVRCPYYQTDNGKNRIVCEGLVPGSKLHSSFRKPKDYRLQMELFCCNNYPMCEICEAIDHKYYQEEEDS